MLNNSQAYQKSPIAKRRSIEELKVLYEPALGANDTAKLATPEVFKKSKVKQIASMFNSKITQDVKMAKHNSLVDKFSPEYKPVPKPRICQFREKAPVPNPRNTAVTNIKPKHTACFVAEDILAKLSVKEKAYLYTLFVEEMSKRNPSFGTHDVKKVLQPLVEAKEKQSTVKQLLEDIEQRLHTAALQRMNSMKRVCSARKLAAETSVESSTTTIKAKDFEKIEETNLSYDIIRDQEKMKPLPLNEQKDSELKTYVSMFVNEDIKKMFLSWFKEKQETVANNANDWDNQSEIDEEKQKSAVDKLVEEAITKLEVIEAEQNEKEARPIPMPRKNKPSSSTTPTSCSDKQSENDESESGLSSLSKGSSEEAQLEGQRIQCEIKQIDNEFKPLRKRKLRRNESPLRKTNQITSTDSDTDNMKSLGAEVSAAQSLCELDQSLMKAIYSPKRIKSAYTLTVYDMETPLSTPRPSTSLAKPIQLKKDVGCMTESLTDPAFVTAYNFMETPIITNPEINNSSLQTTVNSSKYTSFGFSTPNKPENRYSFANINSSKQQIFSPITKHSRNRRRSMYDTDSRRISLAMQVIKEDQLFEPPQMNESVRKLFASASTMEVTKEATKAVEEKKTSQFWIKCGDFSINLEIMYNDAERVRLLYEIFSQKSSESKDLHFGIDDQKFSLHTPVEDWHTSTRVSNSRNTSHYWFSTGDLTIPFSGKYLAPLKIQRIFRLIKETVEDTGVIRFGVDNVEFSNAPEFWQQTPKSSIDSQYDLLVGLQTGGNNGLEGRSKYAWPNRKPVTDLDQSDNEIDNFQETECGRQIYSPFGSNHNDLASLDNAELSMPRRSLAMMNQELYWGEFESEPLDQLFKNNYRSAEDESTLQNEKCSSFVRPPLIRKDALNNLQGTPQYAIELKRIVAVISKIGCSDKFKDCTIEELESYMYYLSRYTEICLNSCYHHVDMFLDAMNDNNSALV